MCTLIILNECVEGFPLVVAANRDERYDRKSQPPKARQFGNVDFIMPWDDEKDGTWIGVSQQGWFVGLTNQDDGTHHPDALSRGKVVARCLEEGNHSAVAKTLVGLDLTQYNPFNLVFGRPGAMFLCRVWEGHELELVPLEQGITVISNDCWGDRYKEKVDWAKHLAHSYTSDSPPEGGIKTVVGNLMGILCNHLNNGQAKDDPFQSLCVHDDVHAFGTKSTSVITVSNAQDVEYWYSEGHPCRLPHFCRVGEMSPRKI